MKNSLIPEETIREWSQTLQQWQELSAEKMPEAARAMLSAAQDAKSAQPGRAALPRSPDPTPTDAQAREADAKRLAQEIAEAQKRAEDVLAALQKMQQNANQNLDQLQALTLAERLRKVGDDEKGLGGLLTSNLPDTIGLPPQELPEKFQRLNTAFIKRQTGAHDESAALQSEISRFFERTQKPNYGKVSQDMKDSRASDELERMGTLIQSNIAVQTSLDLANWSARFQHWADALQPATQAAQPQSGNAQGQPPLDLTRQLIALLRLREKRIHPARPNRRAGMEQGQHRRLQGAGRNARRHAGRPRPGPGPHSPGHSPSGAGPAVHPSGRRHERGRDLLAKPRPTP